MKKSLILITILFSLTSVFSQATSIFSNTKNGFGLSYNKLSVAAMGMGNAGLAASDSTNLNLYNYSQWSLLNFTYFSASYTNETSYFETDDEKGHKSAGTISSLMLAFPIKERKLSFFATFHPAFYMDHKINQSFVSDTLYPREYYITRKGHISQFNFGLAWRIHSKISVSGNFVYQTGNISDEYVIDFPDSLYVDQQFVDNFNINGFGGGLSLTFNLHRSFNIGMYIEKVNKLNFKKEISEYGLNGGMKTNSESELPYNLGIGASGDVGQRLKYAFDVHFRNWRAGVPVSVDDETLFENIWNVNGGIQFVPKARWNSSIFRKTIRRAGFSYGNEGYKFGHHSVKYVTLSFGAGIPVNRTGARLDFAFQFGFRGNLEQNGAREKFIGIGLGLRTGEKWFRRKIQ